MYNKLFEKYGHHCEVESQLKELKIFQNVTNPILRCSYAYRRVNEASWECNQFLRSQNITDNEHYKHVKHLFLIHPFSSFRKGWEIFMSIVFLLEFITIPLELASLQGKGIGKAHTWLPFVVTRFTLDSFCVCDVCLNFITGYLDRKKEEVVMEPLRIIRHYVQTYFVIDLGSSIPESLIMHFIGRNDDTDPLLGPKEINLFEVIVVHISMFKILRVFSFFHFCRHYMSTRNSKATVILRLALCLVIYLVFIHHVVCLSISVSYYTEPESVSKRGGVIVYTPTFNYSYIPHPANSNRSKREIVERKGDYMFVQFYIRYFYETIIMLTRTGTGFIFVRSLYSKIYISVIWFFALIIYFILIAYILSIETSFNASKHKYIEMVRQLHEYMRYKQLPEHLQRRLVKNYEYRFQKNYFRESIIMNNISGHLRQEIVMHSCRKLVEDVVFFKNLPTRLLVQIVTCMEVEVFLENDVIAKANTVGDAMYFIATGTVAIYTYSGLEIVHLDDGHHFGEVAMVKENHMRIASVIAIETSEMYRLDREDFARAILPYPEVLNKIERIAFERMEQTAGLNFASTNIYMTPAMRKDILKMKKSLFYLL